MVAISLYICIRSQSVLEDKGGLISPEDPCSELSHSSLARLNQSLWQYSQAAAFPAKMGLIFQSTFFLGLGVGCEISFIHS